MSNAITFETPLLSESGSCGNTDSNMPEGRSTIVKVIADVFILALVGFPLLIFHVGIEPYHRGIFCNDDSIRYPYKDSTVTNNVLYVVGIFLPTIAICVNEFYLEFKNKQKNRASKPTLFLGKSIPPIAWNLYKQIGVFLFGACLSQLTTDIAKYSIGRLRPHFWSVCNPNIPCLNVQDRNYYFQEFNCLNEDKDKIREGRLSFPSGHSSFSAYTMFYLALYLQGRMAVRCNRLLRPFLQFLVIMLSWSCGLSRVSDYKHHWSDVLAGLLLGATVATIVVFLVSDVFAKPRVPEDDHTSQSTVGNLPPANYNTIDLEQQ